MNKITKAQQKKEMLELRQILLQLMEMGIKLFKQVPSKELMSEIKEMGRLSLELKERISKI